MSQKHPARYALKLKCAHRRGLTRAETEVTAVQRCTYGGVYGQGVYGRGVQGGCTPEKTSKAGKVPKTEKTRKKAKRQDQEEPGQSGQESQDQRQGLTRASTGPHVFINALLLTVCQDVLVSHFSQP